MENTWATFTDRADHAGTTLPKKAVAPPISTPQIHACAGMVNDGNVGWYRESIPGLEIVALGPGYHYVQEDQPEAIADAITNWVPRLPA